MDASCGFNTCRGQIPPFSWNENRSTPPGDCRIDQEIMSNFMRPFVAVFLAVGALLQVPIHNVAFAEEEPKVVDGIAAVVNGEVITFTQVRALSVPQEQVLRQKYTGQPIATK